jgi:hypothetical protein
MSRTSFHVPSLKDGTRVFSISGLIRAVGSRRKGGGRSDDGSFQLPPFLATAGVKPFIPEDLLAPLLSPIPFRAIFSTRSAVSQKADTADS